MTQPTNSTPSIELSELQHILLWYGNQCAKQNGRGSTTPGVDFQEATLALESLLQKRELMARLKERKTVALDNYHGQTFSDGTNYFGKFEKFMRNNERRITELTKQIEEL